LSSDQLDGSPPFATPGRSTLWSSHAVERWLLFSVGFGLLPVLFGYLLPALIGRPQGVVEYLANGPVFIVVAVAAGSTVGGLLGIQVGDRKRVHLRLGWLATGLAIVASAWYAAVQLVSVLAQNLGMEVATNTSLSAWGSLVLFMACVTVGSVSVWFAEDASV
jgi:hypothetical protein